MEMEEFGAPPDDLVEKIASFLDGVKILQVLKMNIANMHPRMLAKLLPRSLEEFHVDTARLDGDELVDMAQLLQSLPNLERVGIYNEGW